MATLVGEKWSLAWFPLGRRSQTYSEEIAAKILVHAFDAESCITRMDVWCFRYFNI